MYTYKRFDTLPEDAAYIRRTVFMEEQGFEEEFDDLDANCSHLVLYQDETPVATCRFYWDEARQVYVIGRLAVLKPYRGQDLGAAMLRDAEQEIYRRQGRRLGLAAQVRAKGFYEKQGYTARGESFLEEYCPHIWMEKDLNS